MKIFYEENSNCIIDQTLNEFSSNSFFNNKENIFSEDKISSEYPIRHYFESKYPFVKYFNASAKAALKLFNIPSIHSSKAQFLEFIPDYDLYINKVKDTISCNESLENQEYLNYIILFMFILFIIIILTLMIVAYKCFNYKKELELMKIKNAHFRSTEMLPSSENQTLKFENNHSH